MTAEADKVDETALTVAVTAEEIEARNAKNVAEALAGVPGLRVSTGRKNEPTVYVHGFDQSRVQVLIDGVPYYETNYGKLDLAQIPTDNVARIEITKGAASVLERRERPRRDDQHHQQDRRHDARTPSSAPRGATGPPAASPRRTASGAARSATG